MNAICLIGIHKYSKILKSSNHEYMRKCSICGNTKHLDNEKLEKNFNKSLNKIRSLFESSIYYDEHHFMELDEILLNIDFLLDEIKIEYKNYHLFYKIENLMENIYDYYN